MWNYYLQFSSEFTARLPSISVALFSTAAPGGHHQACVCHCHTCLDTCILSSPVPTAPNLECPTPAPQLRNSKPTHPLLSCHIHLLQNHQERIFSLLNPMTKASSCGVCNRIWRTAVLPGLTSLTQVVAAT